MRLLAGLITHQIHPDAVAPEQWPAVVTLAQRHGLGQLLYRAVGQESGGVARIAALEPLRLARARLAARHLLALKTQRQLQTLLSGADIPAIWLKGIVLAELVYPAPELRPMADIDVLVPYEQRQAALQVVSGAGFRLSHHLLFSGADTLTHHYQLLPATAAGPMVELHFRLIGVGQRLLSQEQQAWFFDNATQWPGRPDQSRMLRPEAHLLYLAAHAFLHHGEAELRLLQLYDIHRLLAAFPQWRWDITLAGAVMLRWTYLLRRALELAAVYWGAQTPPEVMAELARARPQAEDPSHVTRRQRPRSSLDATLDFMTTLSWPQRLRAAGRILAPPPSYLRSHERLAHSWQLPGAYCRRWLALGAQVWHSVKQKAMHNG